MAVNIVMLGLTGVPFSGEHLEQNLLIAIRCFCSRLNLSFFLPKIHHVSHVGHPTNVRGVFNDCRYETYSCYVVIVSTFDVNLASSLAQVE